MTSNIVYRHLPWSVCPFTDSGVLPLRQVGKYVPYFASLGNNSLPTINVHWNFLTYTEFIWAKSVIPFQIYVILGKKSRKLTKKVYVEIRCCFIPVLEDNRLKLSTEGMCFTQFYQLYSTLNAVYTLKLKEKWFLTKYIYNII